MSTGPDLDLDKIKRTWDLALAPSSASLEVAGAGNDWRVRLWGEYADGPRLIDCWGAYDTEEDARAGVLRLGQRFSRAAAQPGEAAHDSPTPTPAILSLLSRCGDAIDTAAHALYRNGRAAEIEAMTVLSSVAAKLAEAIGARGAAEPKRFSLALFAARVLALYCAPFLSGPVDARWAGKLLEALEPVLREALGVDEAMEGAVA